MPQPHCAAILAATLLTANAVRAQETTPAPEVALPVAQAAPAEPATLSTTEAQAFLGYWMLTARLGERDVKMGLILNSRETMLSGRLVSPFGEMTANNFRRDEEKLRFDLTSGLGLFEVEVWRDGAGIAGRFAEQSGSLAADLTGVESDRVALERFLVPDNETRITRGEDMVRVRFATPAAGERDFTQIEELEPGSVVRFLEFPVIKLTTDLDLRFGGLEVKTENVSDNYPGVYGLWLKRTEDGWSLVFNNKPDVWGTQYDPDSDLGEVPLEMTTAAEPAETLVAELEEAEDGTRLLLTWGAHRWSTPLTIVSE